MSDAEGLRKRKVPSSNDLPVENVHFADGERKKQPTALLRLGTGTFWLTRIVLLRYISFIFCKCKNTPLLLLLATRLQKQYLLLELDMKPFVDSKSRKSQ